MDRLDVLNEIKAQGIVGVIRGDDKEKVFKCCNALKEGGVSILEITLTVDGALDIIKELSKRDDVIVGAGTVLDEETARACILSGAEFIVSPYLNEEVIKLCNKYGVLMIPGVMTLTEAMKAMECGAHVLKLFPSSAFKPSIIKDFKAPIKNINIMPTGGINLSNVGEWIKGGAYAVGVGGQLIEGMKRDDYVSVKNVAEKFVYEIKKARGE